MRVEQGAAYAIIDEAPAGENIPPPYHSDKLILVEDVLTTLQQFALHHRKQCNIPFIRHHRQQWEDTTKELVHTVLASAYVTYTTQGNL